MAVDVAISNRDMAIRAEALAVVYSGDHVRLTLDEFAELVHTSAHYIHDGDSKWLTLVGTCPYGSRCRFGSSGGAL